MGDKAKAISEWHQSHKDYITKLIADGEDSKVIEMCRRNPLMNANRARAILEKNA